MLFLAFLAGCAPARFGEAPELLDSVVIGASTLKVDRGDLARMEQYRGTVRIRSDRLSFEPRNLLFGEYFVSVGDRVAEGQPIAKYDTRGLELGIESNQDYIDSLLDTYAYENRVAEINIAIALAESGGLSTPAVERMQLVLEQTLETQALNLHYAYETREMLAGELEDTIIRAPYDGVITWLADKSPGYYVEPYSGIAYISADDEMFIELSEHIYYFGSLSLDSIVCRVGNSAYELSWIPPEEQELLYYSMMHVTPPVRFRVHEPDDGLTLGNFVGVTLYYTLVDNVLRVPLNCVYGEFRTDAYVYISQDGKKVMRKVELGLRGDVYAEVVSGLEEGDVVFVK